jgi:hypothetical protein
MSTSVIQHCAGVFGIIYAIWLAQEHDTALIEELKSTCSPYMCNEHEGRQRAGFKRRAQQVFIEKDHRRRQVVGSRGRQKVIHRGSKRAIVQAGKRLVT